MLPPAPLRHAVGEAIFETLETAVDPSGDGSEIPTVSTRIELPALPIPGRDMGRHGRLLRSPIVSLKIFIRAELAKPLESAAFMGDWGKEDVFTRRHVDLNLLGNKRGVAGDMRQVCGEQRFEPLDRDNIGDEVIPQLRPKTPEGREKRLDGWILLNPPWVIQRGDDRRTEKPFENSVDAIVVEIRLSHKLLQERLNQPDASVDVT
jgi:hypothetical protein